MAEQEEHNPPLEFSNCVQRHGCMFVLQPDDPQLTILQVSANSDVLVGAKVEDLVGKSFLDFIKPSCYSGLFETLNRPFSGSPAFLKTRNKGKWNGVHFFTAGGIVLELEPMHKHTNAGVSYLCRAHEIIERLNGADDVSALCDILVSELCKLLDYDRVLLLNMQDTGHGKVVADAHRDAGCSSLVNSQFPQYVIPPNSRCNFLKNMQRMIVDVDTDPSPLVPELNPITGGRIDLTLSVLRGVSSCHARYVRNMLVKATFVEAVCKQNGTLWGLVIGHNYTAKHVAFEVRVACRQVMQAFTILLDNKNEAEYQKFEAKAASASAKMLQVATHDAQDDLMSHVAPLIKSILSCDGLAFVSPSNITTVGRCPSLQAINSIAQWLISSKKASEDNNSGNGSGSIWTCRGVWLTQSIGEKVPPHVADADDLNGVCGVLALPISEINQELLLWFRAAETHQIRWDTTTSDPDTSSSSSSKESKAPVKLADAAPITTFSVWRETAVSCSRAWETADIATARQMQLSLADIRTVNEMRLKSRILADMNRELSMCNKQITRVAVDLRQLVSTVPLTIFATDKSMCITEWNPCAEHVTMLSKAAMLGCDFVTKVVELGAQEKVRAVFKEALKGEHPPELEFSMYRDTDLTQKKIDFNLRVAPRLDADGVIMGLVGVCEDLTNKKEAARAHERSILANAANEAKTQFLCSISHEMRTPLNGMLGMLQLAMDADMSAEVGSCLRTALTSGQHLLSVISDVLDVGQIEAGKVQMKFGPTDVLSVVKDAIEIVNCTQNAAKKLQVVLLADHSTIPKRIISDGNRLRQVLVNLISNSIKYSKAGLIKVEISIMEKERQIRLVVRDQGIGMRDSDLKNLFTRFTRVRDETIKDPGGTGLGLVIVKMIVEMLGGHINFESVYGTGTTVTVSIPLVEQGSPTNRSASDNPDHSAPLPLPLPIPDNAQALSPSPSPSPPQDTGMMARRRSSVIQVTVPSSTTPDQHHLSAPATSPTQMALSPVRMDVGREQPLRILLVEDNEINMKVARTMLERQGHSVETAWTGREAVDVFFATAELVKHGASQPYDIVLMDLEMPVMNGLEATQRIRLVEKTEHLPRTPILAFSAHVLQEQEQACYGAGMDAYITKPIIRNEMFQAIRDLIRKGREQAKSDQDAE
mmetsp:Transcript_9849/g.16213  ORF Transcript_9849/g.16213 Transcript_9849/m.16213 type:complete len:1159 (+) Transcript_9849:129-3605(+)|eukprot:CAMPEP_0184647068 /NCGR_PEP_ID=MMETSP0308-20130426/3953_1 /TAXON_ID=38269 /ORGANISM="Gloeochaete witrockiana, Strain SAG 46.84" /LENGTH=1158 /DNA_ID=CAMNT_0027077747 /DNA_START=123 /DNA_END=3599 /DNA_ORIENTATION=-